MNIKRLQKAIDAGLEIKGKKGTVYLYRGLYHSTTCSQVADLPLRARPEQVTIDWAQALETPEAFCRCYTQMVFGHKRVDKYYKHYEVLTSFAKLLEAPFPSEEAEISRVAHRIKYEQRDIIEELLEDDPDAEKLVTRARSYQRDALRAIRTVTERDLVNVCVDESIRRVSDMLYDDIDPGGSLRAGLTKKLEDLRDPTKKIFFSAPVIRNNYYARREIVTSLYALTDRLYYAPMAVMHMLKTSGSQIEDSCISRELNAEELETLKVLYTPQLDGAYQDLTTAVEAAKTL